MGKQPKFCEFQISWPEVFSIQFWIISYNQLAFYWFVLVGVINRKSTTHFHAFSLNDDLDQFHRYEMVANKYKSILVCNKVGIEDIKALFEYMNGIWNKKSLPSSGEPVLRNHASMNLQKREKINIFLVLG